MNFDIKYYKKRGYSYPKYVLAGDIGGTNTRFAVIGVRNKKIDILFSIFFKSYELTGATSAVNVVLKYAMDMHKIKIKNACFGVAGPVSIDRCFASMVNVPWNINAKDIIRQTKLTKLFLVNDFEAIGYGINLLDMKDKKHVVKIAHKNHIHKGIPLQTKAIIGAGTGVGKSILHYEKSLDAYIPINSEGGHVDFPAHDEFEMKLLKFIKTYRHMKYSVDYEQVITGRGIEAIYMFLKSQKKYKNSVYSKEIDNSKDKVPLIAKYKKKDMTSKETFRLFSKFYGRCIKNFALDTLARGGIYIAGGIAQKHKDIFNSKEFLSEFEAADDFSELLSKIPIYIIYNTDVGLLGAGFAAVYVTL